MFQSTTTDARSTPALPANEHETVIRFVITGPYLDDPAHQAPPVREAVATSEVHDLLARINDLEEKLRDERARVDALCRALTGAPASPPPLAAVPEPAAAAEPAPAPASDAPPDLAAVAAPAFAVDPIAAAFPGFAPIAAVASPPAPEPVDARPAAAIAELTPAPPFVAPSESLVPPKLRALSTVASPPPPKVRGLRRMIGALRHL